MPVPITLPVITKPGSRVSVFVPAEKLMAVPPLPTIVPASETAEFPPIVMPLPPRIAPVLEILPLPALIPAV
ncbi:MAG: hypothetical protein ACREDL_09490, partial [Bradyrhizobium sp.]